MKPVAEVEETKIFIWHKSEDDRFYVILSHADGKEEISEQSWATRAECVKAIEEYVKERGGDLARMQ
jgi:hypothetical protein